MFPHAAWRSGEKAATGDCTGGILSVSAAWESSIGDPVADGVVSGRLVIIANSDGSDFRVALTPQDAPAGYAPVGALHHADFAPDGSLVFEADWGDSERIWRLPVGAAQPVLISTGFNNDNSPCVLPDGRVISLWLDRPEGQGVHELKLMAADGSDFSVLLPDVDVFDLGLGCGS